MKRSKRIGALIVLAIRGARRGRMRRATIPVVRPPPRPRPPPPHRLPRPAPPPRRRRGAPPPRGHHHRQPAAGGSLLEVRRERQVRHRRLQGQPRQARGRRRRHREVHAVQRRTWPSRRRWRSRRCRSCRRSTSRRPAAPAATSSTSRSAPAPTCSSSGTGAARSCSRPTPTTGVTARSPRRLVFQWSTRVGPAPRRAAVRRGRRHRQRRHRRLRHGEERPQPAARRAPGAERLLRRASTSTCRRSTTRRCARRSATPSTSSASSTTSTRRAPRWPRSSCRRPSPATPRASTDFTYDPAKAKQLLTEAGFPNGFDVTLSYRDVVRGYLPQPTVVARTSRPSWPQIGINVTLDQQESGDVHRQRQRRQAAVLPARLGRRLPGCHQLPRLPLRRRVPRRSSATGFADIQDPDHPGGLDGRPGRARRRSTPRWPSCSRSTCR